VTDAEYPAPSGAGSEVAEEENMLSDSDQPDILDEILRCLHALGAGLDTTRSAPTKQGGA